MGSSNENSAYGPVHNPRALDATGRVERRLGCGGCGGLRRDVAGLGHRRIDPSAGGILRRGWRTAHLRTRLALRPHRLRLVAGPAWGRSPPTCATRPPCSALSPVKTRRTQPVPTSPWRLCRRTGEACCGPAHRRSHGVLRRGTERGDSRRHRARAGRSARGRLRGEDDRAAAHPLRHPDLLRDCDGGGLGQPLSLRRRALRAEGG